MTPESDHLVRFDLKVAGCERVAAGERLLPDGSLREGYPPF
jgi:hypothetical protein